VEHYVTLFNNLFLPQGLVLHKSMERHIKNYTLWILCVDDDVFHNLEKIGLSNVKLLRLSELETEELKHVKKDRTIAEYCWTLTPFTPKFVFERDENIKRVTYLDADLYFRKNPEPIFNEFDKSGKQVLITEHAYAPEHDQSETSGIYCVQFMTFNRDDGGELVRRWWKEKCIDWCYARLEDGKFGDQKYLDDWPVRFSSQVHVLENKEWALAPWNATRFPYANSIFWHFHGLRISLVKSRYIVLYGAYPLPKCTRTNIYNPYKTDLREAIDTLKKMGLEVLIQKQYSLSEQFKSRAREIYKRFFEFHENKKEWI
jgi:hypothetical protein